MNVLDFKKMKAQRQAISMLTCYDYWTAQILNNSHIDCLLVGDSVAMVMHGHKTTVHADIDLMVLHTQAVVRGAPNKFIIADLPFLSYRKGLRHAMDNVQKLIQAGAQAVKLEGVVGQEQLIRHIVASGVPVMGHIGMTPQSYHSLGGFRVQGKEEDSAKKLCQAAIALEQAGCFALVLECVPAAVAAAVSAQVAIPVIGIGAGSHVDGQVLVLQDLLGGDSMFKPKFLKTYLNSYELIQQAANQYDMEVKSGQFPSAQESYV